MVTVERVQLSAPVRIPPLEMGDHLTREEFERRYAAMPGLKKAELIEGLVFMPSPVSYEQHSGPHGRMLFVLSLYAGSTMAMSRSLIVSCESSPSAAGSVRWTRTAISPARRS